MGCCVALSATGVGGQMRLNCWGYYSGTEVSHAMYLAVIRAKELGQ